MHAILSRIGPDLYSGDLQGWDGKDPLQVFMRKAADGSITCSWWYMPMVLKDCVNHMVFASGTLEREGDAVTGVLSYQWLKKDRQWRATKVMGSKRIDFEEIK